MWPIGTQKQTYQVFDTTLLKPEPFRYAGTTTVDGLTAYKFVEHVVNRQFTTQTLPGSLVGLSDQPSVTLPEYITETNTYWIDPVTGAVLNVNQNQTLTLQQPAGTVRLVLFQGTLTETPQSASSRRPPGGLVAPEDLVDSDDRPDRRGAPRHRAADRGGRADR